MQTQGKEITVSVTFSTVAGRKNVLWTLEEALTSELAQNVRSLMADPAAVGCQIDHPFYGRINIDLAGKF